MQNFSSIESGIFGLEGSSEKRESREADARRIVELASSKDSFEARLDILRYAVAAEKYEESKRSENAEEEYSDFVLRYTDEPTQLRRMWNRISKSETEGTEVDTLEKYEESFKNGVDTAYENGGMENVLRFTEEFFGNNQPKQERSQTDSGRSAGLIEYGPVSLDDEGNRFLQLHFSPLSERPENAGYTYELSLKRLAEQCIDEKRYADYIKRKTWMADMEKSVQYGFQKVKRDPFDPHQGIAVWGQFLSKDGQLKCEEVRYILEHGEPRYQVTEACMDFVEFLRRYAPVDYVGRRIELLKTNPEVLEAMQEFSGIFQEKLEGFFDSHSYEEILELLNRNVVWKHIAGSEVGKKFISLIRDFKEKKKSYEELLSSDEFSEIRDGTKEQYESFADSREPEKIYIDIPGSVL